nr:hypothetical protein [Tanacetum cinerariifolium]
MPMPHELLMDDANDEDEEESSDSEEEEEEHLALTVPAPALYSSVSESDETEPFEESETATTPPPFGYRVAARISVQPHILMPFCSESEVERLLAIPTLPLSPVSLTSYTLPPLLMPLPIYTPLPTSSFPLPSSIPSTSGRLRRERRYFHTVATTYAQEKMAPKRRTTRLNPGTTPVTTPSTTTTSVTNAQLQAMINEGVNAALAAHDATRNGDDSHTSGTGTKRPVQAARECSYFEFLKYKPLDFKGTKGVIELTRWFEKIESVFSISNCTTSNQVKFTTCTLQDDDLTWWNSHVKTTTPEAAYAMTWATLKEKMTGKYCPRGEIKKIETEMWNLKVKGTDVVAYNRRFQQLALMCSRMFPEEIDKIKKYIGGLPDMILGSVKASKSKTMQEVIEFTTKMMEDKTRAYAECQADNKRKSEDIARNNQNQQPNKRQNTGQAYTI